jgi:hypothetical protein
MYVRCQQAMVQGQQRTCALEAIHLLSKVWIGMRLWWVFYFRLLDCCLLALALVQALQSIPPEPLLANLNREAWQIWVWYFRCITASV